MPTIEVSVNGRRHPLQCADGEEARLRQLAADVDRRVSDLASGQTQLGDARLLLMVALLIADELSDAFDEIKRLKTALEAGARASRAAGRSRRSSSAAKQLEQHCGAAASTPN